MKQIYKENIVAVDGRVNIDERSKAINAVKVVKLNNRIGEVRIKIVPYLENALVQRELAKVFKQFKGNDIVYLHLMGSKKTIKTDSAFWVDSEAQGFKEAIIRILGKDCFV